MNADERHHGPLNLVYYWSDWLLDVSAVLCLS